MKRKIVVVLAFFLFGLAGLEFSNAAETEQTRSATNLAALPNFVQLAEELEPVVVNISTRQKRLA